MLVLLLVGNISIDGLLLGSSTVELLRVVDGILSDISSLKIRRSTMDVKMRCETVPW